MDIESKVKAFHACLCPAIHGMLKDLGPAGMGALASIIGNVFAPYVEQLEAVEYGDAMPPSLLEFIEGVKAVAHFSAQQAKDSESSIIRPDFPL